MSNIPEIKTNPPASSKPLSAGVLAAVVLFIRLSVFILLRLTPMMADDFCFARYSGEPMTSLSDVFRNVQDMYMNWDGRAPGAFSTFLFSFLGKNAFDIFQPFLYLGIMLLAYLHAFGRKKIDPLPLLAIFFLSFLYSAAFGHAVLWLVGSCYSFECFFFLLFLLPYRLAAEPGKSNKSVWEFLLSPFIFLLAVYIGCVGANMAAGALLMVVLFLCLYKKNRIPVRPWMIIGFVGIVLGIAVMFAAPGNAHRIASMAGTNSSAPLIDFLHKKVSILYQLTVLLETSHAVQLLGMIFFVGAVKIAFLSKRGTSILPPCLYLLGGLAVIYSLLAAPSAPALRSVYPASILLIIALAATVDSLGLDWKQRPNKTVLITVFLIFGTMFSIKYIADIRDCQLIKSVWNERIDIIHQAQASGRKDVELPPLPPPSRWRPRLLNVYDVGENSDSFINEAVAHYFDLDSVVIEEDNPIDDKNSNPN